MLYAVDSVAHFITVKNMKFDKLILVP